MNFNEIFELKSTDLGGRIGYLRTKTSRIETPALLPVIHPARQLISCREIKAMGYEAVMTNAFTTYRQLKDSADLGIHRIIDFDGTIMTDSGGYQVLEYGSVDMHAEELARFEETLGSDIPIILDKPTGLFVTRAYASRTVDETLKAAEQTKKIISREDQIWTLPIQGGRYLDLVSKSARLSATLDYGCYALGSPVEVMEGYDFTLLVRMILAAKKNLNQNRPFHLFGAGHPLIIPLAIALGCDLFDSASYILYAKQDRYISSYGTEKLETLEYLGCSCEVCKKYNAKELRALPKEERIQSLARHNLLLLKSIVEQAKQAISEGRLWEYVQSSVRSHPNALEAFRFVASESLRDENFDAGTPLFKDRGLFYFDKLDKNRPELQQFRKRINFIDLSKKKLLVILPETMSKPFLTSKIFSEVSNIISRRMYLILVAFLCPNIGLVPAEISDIYPLSQYMNSYKEFPNEDPILSDHKWRQILVLIPPESELEQQWIRSELLRHSAKGKASLKSGKARIKICRSYKQFKKELKKAALRIDRF